MYTRDGIPVPRLLCFCQTDLLLRPISTGFPSKIPFFRRNGRSRRGEKTMDGISVPRFRRFLQNGSLTMYTFDTTVQYGTAVNQVQYSTAHHAEQQKYFHCTVQYRILWMLHCKKSPSPVTHSKTHVFCERAKRDGQREILFLRICTRSRSPFSI